MARRRDHAHSQSKLCSIASDSGSANHLRKDFSGVAGPDRDGALVLSVAGEGVSLQRCARFPHEGWSLHLDERCSLGRPEAAAQLPRVSVQSQGANCLG